MGVGQADPDEKLSCQEEPKSVLFLFHFSANLYPSGLPRMTVISTIHPVTSLTSEFKTLLRKATDSRLQKIIHANITARFARWSPSLADFRLAVEYKNAKHDATILDDFRQLVPLTNYESYLPLIRKLMECPCKLSEVENLLAPGLPSFLCDSSSTSGKEPKFFPKYGQSLRDPSITNLCSGSGKIVNIWSISRALVDVVADSGEVVHTMTLSAASSGTWRTTMNWTVQTDETRMMSIGTYVVRPSTNCDVQLV